MSDSVSDDNLLTPGSLWKYIGPVKPVVQDETESILEIRERDLLASLQRLVRKESENSSGDVFPLLPDFTVIQNTVIEDTSEISCKVGSLTAIFFGTFRPSDFLCLESR